MPQEQGIKQGDPLAPGLCAFGQHDSLTNGSPRFWTTFCFFFFFRTFLKLQVTRRVRSLCQLQTTVAGHALSMGREAVGLRSLLPASVGEELVQCWGRAGSTQLRLDGELQKGGSERTLRRNGD